MRLRDDLTALADRAGPLRLDPATTVARVRRRRQLATVGAAATVLGLLAAVSLVLPGVRGNGPPLAVAPSYPRPFVCGEELLLGPGAADSQSGLGMALSRVEKTGDGIGPTLEATFTADRDLHVSGSPTRLFEVIYVRDGIVVGGGPMLNEAGDLTPQGFDLVGGGFSVGPAAPWTESLGRRDRLCSTLTWPQIWSAPGRYEAILVMGPVLPGSGPGTLRLEIATLGYWPLLVARAPLPA